MNTNTNPNSLSLNCQSSVLPSRTPPPPLQPIVDETLKGLFHYFGADASSVGPPQPPAPLLSSIRLVCNNPTAATASDTSSIMEHDGQIESVNVNVVTQPPVFSFSREVTAMSLQEKKHALSRKLAQRAPKHELVERGILPRSRVPLLHYDQMKHLEKAQLQDILENKLEKRPNREILIQKNILPDSKAAPSLQLKCNELKRARLADDLNEKLAKRPGPLELVESGILVSNDSALTEAIRDGKITYPRTTDSLLVMGGGAHQQLHPHLNSLNVTSPVEFTAGGPGGLDEENSNFSQATTATTSSSSYNFVSSPVGSVASAATTTASPRPKTLSSNGRKIKSSSSMSTISSSSSIKSNKSAIGISNNSSNQSSNNNSNKKVLIFHEYRGPNQKSSKTSFKITTAQPKSQTKSRLSNTTSASASASVSSSGLQTLSPTQSQSQSTQPSLLQSQPTIPVNMSTNQVQENLLAPFEDTNSNESNSGGGGIMSANLFEENDANIEGYSGRHYEELLDAYKIRLEQQKMFLLFDTGELQWQQSNDASASNAVASNSSNSGDIIEMKEESVVNIPPAPPLPSFMMQQQAIASQVASSGLNTADKSVVEQPTPQMQMQTNFYLNENHQVNMPNEINLQINNEMLTNSTNNTNMGTQQQQQQQQQQTMSNQIQLVPIGDIQILDNLKSLISNGGLVTLPLRAIPLSQIDQQQQQQSSDLPPSVSSSSSSLSTSSIGNNTIGLSIPIPQNQQQSLPAFSAVADQEQKQETEEILVNLEEMSVSRLREECMRRKLPKTGVKQKLIERLKNSNSQLQRQQSIASTASTVKSPDSGVNLDVSPSLQSCEPSPCNSINSIIVNRLNPLHTGQKQQQTKQQFIVPSSMTLPLNGSETQIDNFLELNQQNMNQLGENEQMSSQPPQNLAATLEMSLKNSTEILKQLSSVNNIEDLDKLERQMKESMQLVEKLKMQQQQQQQHHQNSPPLSNDNSTNKLRLINSLPSDMNLGGIDIKKQDSVYQFEGLMRELTSSTNTEPNLTPQINHMDWNNTELMAIYHELDQHDSLMSNVQPQTSLIGRKQPLVEDNRISLSYIPNSSSELTGTNDSTIIYHQFDPQSTSNSTPQQQQTVIETSLWDILEPDYNQINQIMSTSNATVNNSNNNGFIQSPTI